MASHSQALESGGLLAAGRRRCQTGPVTEIEMQLKAARRGDGDAFADLFLAHARPLRVMAFGVLRDPDLVDDALQEAALRAYRSLRGFRGEARIGTWLHRITLSVCLDMIHEAHRQDTLVQRSLPTHVSDPDLDSALDTHTRLSRALDTLTAEQRAVAVVVLQLGFDLRSAATILAIPRGTVASRLFAARQALAAALGSTEEDDA